MTITLDGDIYAALEYGPFVHRTFVYLTARDRDTGDPIPDGYWNDHGVKTVQVLNPETGALEDLQFYGSGGLVSVDEIPRVLNVQVQRINITLTNLAARVNDLLRTYDVKFAPITVYRGLFDPDTREMVSYAYSRFYGFVDECVITTPAAGASGGDAVLTCTSHTQEMSRSNTDTRSSDSQKIRSATDTFYDRTQVVGTWTMWWGRKREQISDKKKKSGK